MMKFSRREGDFTCRPPTTFEVLIVFIFILKLPQPANGSSCGYDEALQCSNSNSSDCSCLKCLVCPPGEGLYPQCGSTVLKNDTTMQCKPCKRGTYSDQRDFGSCRSCDPCARIGQETLRKCTATQNSICNKGCKEGFKWNEIFERCIKVLDERKQKTALPDYDQKPTTTPLAEKSTLPSTKKNNGNNNASEPNEPHPKTTQNMTSSTGTPLPAADQHVNNWNSILIYVSATVIPLVLVTGFLIKKRVKIIRFFSYLYCSSRGRSPTDQQGLGESFLMNSDRQEQEQDEEIILDSSDSHREDMDPVDQCNASLQLQQGESSGQGSSRAQDHASTSHQEQEGAEDAIAMSNNTDLCGLLFKDLSLELKCNISVTISKISLPGWKEIGGYFKIPKAKLEEFGTRCTYGSGGKLPGEYLFDYLESDRPELTVKEFVDVLKAIKRIDVVHDIYKECCK